MRSAVIVVINPASDVLTGFPAAGEGIQIDAFIFEAAPQTFDKDVDTPINPSIWQNIGETGCILVK